MSYLRTSQKTVDHLNGTTLKKMYMNDHWENGKSFSYISTTTALTNMSNWYSCRFTVKSGLDSLHVPHLRFHSMGIGYMLVPT